MKSCLDPTFEYTPASKTDLKKTFDRVRREEKAKAKAQGNEKTGPAKVSALDDRRRNGTG